MAAVCELFSFAFATVALIWNLEFVDLCCCLVLTRLVCHTKSLPLTVTAACFWEQDPCSWPAQKLTSGYWNGLELI